MIVPCAITHFKGGSHGQYKTWKRTRSIRRTRKHQSHAQPARRRMRGDNSSNLDNYIIRQRMANTSEDITFSAFRLREPLLFIKFYLSAQRFATARSAQTALT